VSIVIDKNSSTPLNQTGLFFEAIPSYLSELDCPEPPARDHAYLSLQGRSVGDYMTYMCHPGYALVTGYAIASSLCSNQKYWYPLVPACLGKVKKLKFTSC